MIKQILFPILIALAISPAFSQNKGANPTYRLIAGSSFVKSKNTYLLTLFEEDHATSTLLQNDSVMVQLTQRKLRAVAASLSECKAALCLPVVLKFTDQEIKAVSTRLSALYKPGNALGHLVQNHLIPSGTYILYDKNNPAELLVKAWEQDALAVNYIINVYAEGKKPNYPAIDSISFNTKEKSYFTLMYDCSTVVKETVKTSRLFFEPSLEAALTYLQINEREVAAADEPMISTVNKLAFERIKSIKWSQYPYSHILVPGAGPEDPATPLSGEGMLRCRLAALQYRAGKAPFIVVSGGNVHPFKTKYNEASEMKQYLINRLHIPANAILLEPHARHTTTNLRNDARLIFRYGIPFNKLGYIVTDKYQNDFILTMADRCKEELHYLPYKLGRRISDTELEFYPLVESLQIDADEPLDP